MSAADRGAIATRGFLPGVNLAAILTRGFWAGTLRRPTTPPHRKPFGVRVHEVVYRAKPSNATTRANVMPVIFKAVILDADPEGQ